MPHQGSDSARWTSFAANLLKSASIGISAKTVFVSKLVKGSTTLANISNEFVDRARDMIIYTFYETIKLNGVMVRPGVKLAYNAGLQNFLHG